MPPNTVVVHRPSKWGNPFKLKEFSREESMKRYRYWLTHHKDGLKLLASIEELRGKNLACFCKLDVACHGDILLEFANKQNGEEAMSGKRRVGKT